MNRNFYCVIMAGGIGTRFWPLSRNNTPKQFLETGSDGNSLLRSTFDRFKDMIPEENILVVTADRFKDTVMKQLPELREENLLLEPYGRDTAPCIAYASYKLMKRNPEATVAITPADHIIPDTETFRDDISRALDYAKDKDILMTLGITPSRPDPNYGYIQVSGGRCNCQEQKAVKVKTFTEKPDTQLAKIFLESGEFFWNSGILVCRAESIKDELERHLPEVTKLFTGWENAIDSPVERNFIEKAYTDCIKISIDYGIMEKTDKSWMYPARFHWTDIGSWESLYSFLDRKDENGNAVVSAKNLCEGNVECLVISKNKNKLMAISGLKDFIVIDTDDALLICPKDDQKVKEFLTGLAMPGYEKFR